MFDYLQQLDSLARQVFFSTGCYLAYTVETIHKVADISLIFIMTLFLPMWDGSEGNHQSADKKSDQGILEIRGELAAEKNPAKKVKS